MKKELVGVHNLDSFICRTNNAVYADGTIVLTAGARDALAKRKVPIVYGPKPEAEHDGSAKGGCPPECSCTVCSGEHVLQHDTALEALLIAVAATLKNHYGVHDPETLKNMSCQIVRAIQEAV